MASRTIRKIIRFIDFGMFPGTLCFCHGFTIPELIEHFSKKKYKDYKPYLEALKDEDVLMHKAKWLCYHAEMPNGKENLHCYFIIIKEQFLFKDGSYVSLAHEVLHLCQFYLKKIL